MTLFNLNLHWPDEWFKRRENVILVEDDEHDLFLMCRALEAEGFRVLPAQSAEKALGILETDGHRFRLLITDIRLLVSSGLDLMAEVRASYPSTRVVIVTGSPALLVDVPAGVLIVAVVKCGNMRPAFRELSSLLRG